MNKADHFIVIAGWLPEQPQIGTCYIDRARGTEVFSFEYERGWISSYPDFFLDPDLRPIPGRQYVPIGKSCFGFLSDAAPDRWGRKLMERREAADARLENRSIRRLMESDYILGVHDGGRMGVLQNRLLQSGGQIGIELKPRLFHLSILFDKRHQLLDLTHYPHLLICRGNRYQ